MLEEVFTAPKPGLVDCLDNGAHRDMNLRTFLLSTASITPFLRKMAEAACYWGNTPETLLPALKPIGRDAENAMLKATGNVNTHKGAIFTMGLLSAAAGWLHGQGTALSAERILSVSRRIAEVPLRAEILQLKTNLPRTHGEELLLLFGETGIRGEAAAGFPVISDCALPALRASRRAGEAQNEGNLNVLLHILLRLNDTNVLNRGGYEALRWLRSEAVDILRAGGAASLQGKLKMHALNQACICKNISPGGSADILAATLFLHALETLPAGRDAESPFLSDI